MELKDIITLINAGYSKEEISAFAFGAAAPAPAAPAEPEEPAAPAEPEEPAAPAEPEAPAAPAEPAAVYDDSGIRAELAELKKMMQTMALLRDSAPAPVSGTDAAVEVLANVIKPSKPSKPE